MDYPGMDYSFLQLIVAIALIFVLWFFLQHKSDGPPQHRSVAVIVLGDIGRSPRIMYHAQSFAYNDFVTYLVGYQGSRVVQGLLTLPRVRFMYLSSPPVFLDKLPQSLFILLAPFKVAFQLTTIFYTLFYRIQNPPEFILVQNPPSIPTLALVWLAGKIRGSKVIIDWHNLGYSILALKLGNNHVLVKLAKWFEKTLGRSAFAHLFVTQAIRDYLENEWSLEGHKIVFHDRPPAHFHHCLSSEVHDLFLRLSPTLDPTLSSFLPSYSLPMSTPFTTVSSESRSSTPASIFPSPPLHTLRPDRPALVVSSTSWTEDEDFSILTLALSKYEQSARNQSRIGGSHLPKMLVIVTGKGPLREQYMRQIQDLEQKEGWKWVRCRSLWLEAEDYPLLLGSADLGVSLHASSSALDLPMKVVDMFGCGLPVLALDFKCLDELVTDGKNGLVFRTANELASHFTSTLASFPASPRLTQLRDFFQHPSHWDWCSWSENWDHILRPIVTHDVDVNAALLAEVFRNRRAQE